METTTEQDKGRTWRKGLVAAGAAVGLTLAGLGVSWAQTDGPTTTEPPANETAPADAPKLRAGPGPGGHRGGHGLKGMGIHGEFVTRAPGGGYQTIATQRGEVTSVTATELKVKSEDGFERTYVVNDDTMVNAGNEGIADVKVGDQVHVQAVVADGKANAKHVMDATQAKALRDKCAPPRPARPAD